VNISSKQYVALFVALAVIAVFFVFSPIVPGLNSTNQSAGSDLSNPYMSDNASSGLLIQDTVVGTGAEATPGKLVRVDYTGILQSSGQKFDSSIDRGQPFEFVLGSGQVIPGWEKGIAGMKVGGQRILVIAPELAYGSQQIGPIPPNSTLVFTVQLLEVGDAP